MDKKDVLIRDFLKGKVSRRDFQNGLVGMGLTAAAAGTLVESTIKEAQAATPQSGGSLKAAPTVSSAANTLDPALIIAGVDIMRSALLYNRLIDDLPGQDLVGNLATEWGADADATQWRITLLDGVEFHNGKTMTAADVAYSFNRHLDPEGRLLANVYVGDVDNIVADGDNVVVFNMKAPNADVSCLLSEYHFTVQPEGADAANYVEGEAIGTGAWKVAEFEPGIVGIFERHPPTTIAKAGLTSTRSRPSAFPTTRPA